jgi:glycosyltransferase involved in cell wall biosynthesis
MRVAVNAFRLSGQKLGVGRYLEHLLHDWQGMLEPDDAVLVCVRDRHDARTLRLSDAFDVRELPSRVGGALWEHLVLTRHLDDADVLFGPAYTLPLNYRGRSVVAIHSVNEAQPGAHSWSYRFTTRKRYALSARKADAVIVPSQSAKSHLEELYRTSPDNVVVVPQGVDEAFKPVADEPLLRETRRRYVGGDRPYVLFVGKFSARRNVPALIRAFGAVKRRLAIPHALLLFGPNVTRLPIDELAEELDLDGDVFEVNEQFVDHRDIVPVYSAADLFVHPSSYEGFSLTIVEAMACGAPVLTVNRGAAAEITDGTALTVDEPTVESLARALERALTDAEFRSSLSRRALERAKSFRNQDTARGTLDVLRRVAET